MIGRKNKLKLRSVSDDFIDVHAIYIITNSVNKNQYIGLTNNLKRRITEHVTPKNIKNRSTNLAKAFRKYGVDAFYFSVLETLNDPNDLAKREVYWISKIKPSYNMNDGGLGNPGRKLSVAQKENLRKIGAEQWRLKTSKEKATIVREQLKGRSQGYSHSDKTKEKLRAANLGKKMPEHVRDKISTKNKISMIGNNNGNKAVVAKKTGSEDFIFESALSAAEFLGIHPSNITKVLKKNQKTAGGFSWSYYKG